VPDVEAELGYVLDAVSLIRRELHGRVPLIGFSGSPWTLATYMVEGGSRQDLRPLQGDDVRPPGPDARPARVLAASVTAYLNAQIARGARR
jgi:uroporphyrinogen decarboxylase